MRLSAHDVQVLAEPPLASATVLRLDDTEGQVRSQAVALLHRLDELVLAEYADDFAEAKLPKLGEPRIDALAPVRRMQPAPCSFICGSTC